MPLLYLIAAVVANLIGIAIGIYLDCKAAALRAEKQAAEQAKTFLQAAASADEKAKVCKAKETLYNALASDARSKAQDASRYEEMARGWREGAIRAQRQAENYRDYVENLTSTIRTGGDFKGLMRQFTGLRTTARFLITKGLALLNLIWTAMVLGEIYQLQKYKNENWDPEMARVDALPCSSSSSSSSGNLGIQNAGLMLDVLKLLDDEDISNILEDTSSSSSKFL